MLKYLESPFADIVEQSIIGSDRFVDSVKRKYLLLRAGDKKEEPALVHLQQSFRFDDVIKKVAAYFGVKPKLIVTRKSGHRVARRLAMYCVCIYCRHGHSLGEMAGRFSVSASALTQARDAVANDSSSATRKTLRELKKIITRA